MDISPTIQQTSSHLEINMQYILTKFIKDLDDPLDKQFRGSFLFESTRDMIRFAEDDRTQAVTYSSKKVSDNKFELDEELLCPCKATEIMRISRPLMYYTVGSYIVEFFVSIVNHDENAEAYKTLLDKSELKDRLNVNCFINNVQLGNFTSTYNYRDHGYIDVGLCIENPTKSILEKGQMPYIEVLVRIFIETVSSEHQRDLWNVLRGFRMNLEECIRKTSDNPIQYPSLGDATLSIKDNCIKLEYKFHNGDGCVDRLADRVQYQVLKIGK